jgi:hypothetical protein
VHNLYCYNLYGHSGMFDKFDCVRIINAVKSSGVLKERLFRAAYNSKKQALMSGMYSQ